MPAATEASIGASLTGLERSRSGVRVRHQSQRSEKDEEKDVLRKTPTELVNRSVGGEGCGEERARSMNWRTVATLGSKKLSEYKKIDDKTPAY